MESAGAKTSANELRAFADGLEKFKDQTLTGFTKLLERLSETGEVAPKGGRTKQPAAPKAPPADPGTVAAEAKRLYEHAAQGIDESDLVALKSQLGILTAAGLKVVAAALNFTPTGKESTKPKLTDAIVRKIEKREGATIRRNVINRPEGGHTVGNGVPAVPGAVTSPPTP
ncbi:hypothetical protein [Gemmata sp.]|uniref:hypothetical protein n=1 Tax=Gemmata sp. TaxID=1914242 RepID=UPI003F6FB2FE